MELQTINQVTKNYGISARMLRYYEQVGLITSLRKDDYAYRVYDETALKRLQYIIILRKLRIPVKQITDIFNNQNALSAVKIFEQNIVELDEEITALSTVKSILLHFVEELRDKANILLKFDLLDDEKSLSIIDSLSFSKNHIKESLSMDELNKADESLTKLKEKYIRIVNLPPMTIAEVNFYGATVLHGEEIYLSDDGHADFSKDGKSIPGHFQAGINAIDRLIHDCNLVEVMPSFRVFGFANCSDMENYGPFYGFGRWLTIPDAMDVPFPFIKKKFMGGMYGAYSRPLPTSDGDSDEWEVLNYWVMTNDKYEYDGGREPECNYGLLEEYLNYINLFELPTEEKLVQADLLIPIKLRKK
ncbi:MAG: putative MerR family transcriptional regulator [Herbinix sp.]|jgi:DNA-binding transcriptional MerR regulator|nr:putative MerR family transcriptional regulator [Herbinix sp.]